MNRKLAVPVLLLVLTAVVVTALWPTSTAKAKVNRRFLSKVIFIHHKKGHAKPSGVGNAKKDKESEGVYSYIAKGARWKELEALVLNPACTENPDGGMDETIIDATLTALDEWETGGSKNLAIFGDLLIDDNITYEAGAYRSYNTITFGHYPEPGVIAVTSVWGYFTGPPSMREIVEAHILMNDDYEWADATVDELMMDVQNIMTHELGHWAGMADVYDATATEETMYGYSTEGETKKRDLYYGDINGITGLYK